MERVAEFRSEYYRGELFAMSGGSLRHSLIATNVLAELRSALKGQPCIAFNSDLRIRVSTSGLFTYPDAGVVCGEPQFDDRIRDTVLNPTLIVEVLSDSTEAYDRGKKFEHYWKLGSLRDYLLISQDSPKLELFSRNADDTWTLVIAQGLEQSLTLPALGVTLELREVYDKVDFSNEKPAAEA